MTKEYWLDKNRFLVITIILLLIFFTFMAFMFIEIETIKKTPCGVCAEKMGSDVYCTIGNSMERITRTFSPNGSIEDVRT